MKALKNILIVILIAALGFLGYLFYKNISENKDTNKNTIVEEKENPENEDEDIAVDEKNINDLKEYLLEDISMIIVDLRDMDSYNEGHIEGAISIPFEKIEELSQTNLLDKEQNIYVYSGTKEDSDKGAKALTKLGYTNVHSLGSIDEYEGEKIN
ncbi:rhodanese-like domain-containing protein [Peptoniphilus sp. BV3AC2]|uniref:rhodanese-like domain-containing protein n=1 Tax=Peptoniphilus sp. BV3AC2 TaxID=1111133 RepID=UPI0003B85EE9|nr:rhodanese-like domain-containing protein [Peptoniphilus sp. BV3AC2]ERT64110.1 rhodanese-like protein [Peptoniphilus sp. BV3AC2]